LFLRRKLQCVSDCFALLNQPRRPWLDLDLVKKSFLELSTELHPDRLHNAGDQEKAAAQKRYSELNAAYNCLRDHKTRILHLLELERSARPSEVHRIPDHLIPLFTEVNQLCRQVDALLDEKRGLASPLLQVQLFEKAQQDIERLTNLQKLIHSQRERLLAELEMIDVTWEQKAKSGSPDRAAAFERLEELYRQLSYFMRWGSQLQERVVELSL